MVVQAIQFVFAIRTSIYFSPVLYFRAHASVVGGLVLSKSIHPFPARMAPELALAGLGGLAAGSVVADPMTGSGTVCRYASDAGHKAIGLDMDPLAVLMTKVWTNIVDDDDIGTQFAQLKKDAAKLHVDEIVLPGIDEDEETRQFTEFWFGQQQREQLRKLSFLLAKYCSEASSNSDRAVVDVLRLALSRIIVTKDRGASLARDVSHSRPHKVIEASDYDVFVGYERSLKAIRTRLLEEPPSGGVSVNLGDARQMNSIGDGSVDAVLTSPPYLNAIDYLRGHRLALVWLGHSIKDLRRIRSDSIGSERRPDTQIASDEFKSTKAAMGSIDGLSSRFQNMIDRYVQDLLQLLSETARILRVRAKATFVVGNSCLRGVYVDNAAAVEAAAQATGLRCISRIERPLPEANRYLPLTSEALGKRMRTEVILTLCKA